MMGTGIERLHWLSLRRNRIAFASTLPDVAGWHGYSRFLMHGNIVPTSKSIVKEASL
jgi:hypothetical protein